ncbi:polysaccharide pyruvyl transferase family protein, partial [Klebsiella michiganensis]
ALVLDDIKREKAMDVILLPIGYASGHDDSLFLSEVKKYSREEIELLDDLNVWEIMFIISKAKAFYGTSLHGVITAMSFGVPHYCINSDIKKLTSFLNTWSISPFNESLTINNIFNSISFIESYDNTQLLKSVENTQSLIMSSLNDIVNMLE